MNIKYSEAVMRELAKTDRLLAFHIKNGISLEAVFNSEVYDEENQEFIEAYQAAYKQRKDRLL
jgi:hypothetical protein